MARSEEKESPQDLMALGAGATVSESGDKIAFAGLRHGVWNIWWVSRDGKAQKQALNYTKPNSYVRYPAWSPRGAQIVYEFAETIGNIWMMELN